MKEEPIIENSKDPGYVLWDESRVEWHDPSGNVVVVKLDNVAIIGEFKMESGPIFEDWFLTFIYRTGDWDSISIYSQGMVELKSHLSQVYKVDFSKYFPANSTLLSSHVRYPIELEGRPFFVVQPPNSYREPKTFSDKVRYALRLGIYSKSWEVELTDEVKSSLNPGGS